MTIPIRQVKDTSQLILIFNLICKRNKRQEILVCSLHYQRSYQQENGSASNPVGFHQNLDSHLSCIHEGCERVMAQKEATQNEAKRKAAERKANKEIRRKKKEERAK